MTLFDKMRRAFGLSSDDDEVEVYRDDQPATDVSPSAKPSIIPQASNALTPQASQCNDTDCDTTDGVAADMMAGVVELFNSFQPDFIAKCLDPERQKTLLAESMAPALRQRLAAIIADEKERIDRAASDERSVLDADLKKLRDRNAELERRRAEFKDEQLSASRQKRALKERVHDLEIQVEKLEGDKEQLELENRSMANKLRASGIGDHPNDPAHEQNAARLEQALKEAAENAGKLSALTADNEKLLQDNEALKEQCGTATADNEKLLQANEALKERCKVADDMMADLRRRLAEAEKAAAEAAESAEKAKSEMADTPHIDATQDEVDELRRQVDLLQGIAEQAEKFADVAEKKDARIAELKGRLKDAEKDREEIKRLEDENRSLRSTIESNLYEHAAEMSELRRRLEESKPRRGRPRKPRNETEAEGAPAGEKAKSRHDKQPKISAIDELIESNEWLMAPTPEELAPKVEEPSDDFGYHAPVHKATIHDDANQLTLF